MQPRFDFNNVTLNYSNEVTRRRWETWAASAEVRPQRKADPLMATALYSLGKKIQTLCDTLETISSFTHGDQRAVLRQWMYTLGDIKADTVKLRQYVDRPITDETATEEVKPEQPKTTTMPHGAVVGKFYDSKKYGKVFCCTTGNAVYSPAFAVRETTGQTTMRYFRDFELTLADTQSWDN